MYIDRIITASASSSTTVITPDLKKATPRNAAFLLDLYLFSILASVVCNAF